MPNNADHMHYYIFSKGKYKRKLVDKEYFMLCVLAGGKVGTNDTWNKDGVVRGLPATNFRHKIVNKVYFPYSILAHGLNQGNIRAKFGNKCPQCPPLDVYWNTGGTNGTV